MATCSFGAGCFGLLARVLVVIDCDCVAPAVLCVGPPPPVKTNADETPPTSSTSTAAAVSWRRRCVRRRPERRSLRISRRRASS